MAMVAAADVQMWYTDEVWYGIRYRKLGRSASTSDTTPLFDDNQSNVLLVQA